MTVIKVGGRQISNYGYLDKLKMAKIVEARCPNCGPMMSREVDLKEGTSQFVEELPISVLREPQYCFHCKEQIIISIEIPDEKEERNDD